ncbi:MAG TPA: DNA cytosine methyltransferase, partial [Cyclobacteriaceae bacterium]|nr:DNA cytosine methyltransferase [Cyclobacteriaceae bacterium]
MNVKFYLDKADKSNQFPIHLVLRQKDVSIKASTGEKIKKEDWDTNKQCVKDSEPLHTYINDYLSFLKKQVQKYLEVTPHQHLTEKKVKAKISELVQAKKKNAKTNIVSDDEVHYQTKQRVTFIDLFAGAGGFSEGFLQAESGENIYDFLVASDINENCELTHLARYNYQLGMDAEFLRQDITEPDFLDNLLKKVDGRAVDVVCGGPPCQSFSLAGKRKKFDKKDDLFSHYLNVIRRLRPKYFVMENVKGILTKEEGRIQQMIVKEIRSIIDLKEFDKLLEFIVELKKLDSENSFTIECFNLRLQFESAEDKRLDELREKYLLNIESRFRSLTPKIVDYKTSKTDKDILTIRHGINLLRRTNELAYIRKKVINEKAYSDIDEDFFVDEFDKFLAAIEPDTIVEKINQSFQRLKPSKEFKEEIEEILRALEIYTFSFDECMDGLEVYAKKAGLKLKFDNILEQIRLYKIDAPFVALASNYGVPQNRERVLFIGCRKDQKLIKDIPATVSEEERVTVFEALYDLDFIGNDDEK